MMPNCAFARKGSNKIEYFLKNCYREGYNFHASNHNLGGIKLTEWDIVWTNDDANEVAPPLDHELPYLCTDWDKDISDLTPTPEPFNVEKPSHDDFVIALNYRKQLADLTYAQIDNYIENNVTNLLEAKDYLKLLSKVTLGIIKIIDAKL